MAVLLKFYRKFSAQQSAKDSFRIKSFPPEKITCDWVGPVDSESNLRQYKLHVSPEEGSLEKQYRTTREATMEWNHEFWKEHNRCFKEEKKQFTEKLDQQDMSEQERSKEMASFYKAFLDRNLPKLKAYNLTWYRKHSHLLWLSARVKFSKLFRFLK